MKKANEVQSRLSFSGGGLALGLVLLTQGACFTARPAAEQQETENYCEKCKKSYRTKGYLEKHRCTATAPKPDLVERSLEQADKLRKAFPYICPVPQCGDCYKQKGSFRHHYRTKHSEKDDFNEVLAAIEETLGQHSTAQAAVKTHTKRPKILSYKCLIDNCGHLFKTQEKLSGHQLEKHSTDAESANMALPNLTDLEDADFAANPVILANNQPVTDPVLAAQLATLDEIYLTDFGRTGLNLLSGAPSYVPTELLGLTEDDFK